MKLFFLAAFIVATHIGYAQPSPRHDLIFDSLATTWDEGIPLGNGILGALIWEKNGELRFALDRADLWDQRPMKGLHGPHFSYKWITGQVRKKDYRIVQQNLDEPYEREAAPTKIPGAALMINSKDWGVVKSVQLDIAKAECRATWKNGIVLKTFVHATKPVGWFRIENFRGVFKPRIDPPPYKSNVRTGSGSIDGDDLNRLGYAAGTVKEKNGSITYHQEGWGGFSYRVEVKYKKAFGLSRRCVYRMSGWKNNGTSKCTSGDRQREKMLLLSRCRRCGQLTMEGFHHGRATIITI